MNSSANNGWNLVLGLHQLHRPGKVAVLVFELVCFITYDVNLILHQLHRPGKDRKVAVLVFELVCFITYDVSLICTISTGPYP